MKNTQWELTKGRETSCLVICKGKKKEKKKDDQLVSLVSNSKIVKVPSNNVAVTVHKNMVITSFSSHNSEKINYKDYYTCKSQPKVSVGQYDVKELPFQI